MGVKGLGGFLKRHSGKNFEFVRLRDTFVVIDGNNFVYNLYESRHLKKQFTGEYLEFEEVVTELIDQLDECAIRPIFVFDGLHEVSCNYFTHLNIKNRLSRTGKPYISSVAPRLIKISKYNDFPLQGTCSW